MFVKQERQAHSLHTYNTLITTLKQSLKQFNTNYRTNLLTKLCRSMFVPFLWGILRCQKKDSWLKISARPLFLWSILYSSAGSKVTELPIYYFDNVFHMVFSIILSKLNNGLVLPSVKGIRFCDILSKTWEENGFNFRFHTAAVKRNRPAFEMFILITKPLKCF